MLRTTLVVAALGSTAAFVPGSMPLRCATPVRASSSDIVMMPKFLKDLFPDMEKPEDALAGIKSFFGIKEEEPAPAEEPAPEDEPAPEAEE